MLTATKIFYGALPYFAMKYSMYELFFFSDFILLYFNVYFLRKEKHHNDEEE